MEFILIRNFSPFSITGHGDTVARFWALKRVTTNIKVDWIYLYNQTYRYTMIIIMICKRKQDRGNKWYHTSVLAFSFFFLSRGKFIVQWQGINLRCLWNMIPIWTTLYTIYHYEYILEIVLKKWNRLRLIF